MAAARPPIGQEEVGDFLARALRDNAAQFHHYGYDVYLPRVIERYIYETTGQPRNQPVDQQEVRRLSPLFYAAAWDLCRHGVLRPGVREYGGQDASRTDGYSITPYGQEWLNRDDQVFVPTDRTRLTTILSGFNFGEAYVQRATEAVACYNSGAYLACCAMCGAAAESILFSLGLEKFGEPRTLELYRQAAGRTRLAAALTGQCRQAIQREIGSFTDLISYWRDEAAHAGIGQPITEAESYMALRSLLRFAQFATSHRDEIVEQRP